MSGIRSTLTPQDLALHDAGELLPQSPDILGEDVASGRVVMRENIQEITTTRVGQAVEILKTHQPK